MFILGYVCTVGAGVHGATGADFGRRMRAASCTAKNESISIVEQYFVAATGIYSILTFSLMVFAICFFGVWDRICSGTSIAIDYLLNMTAM